MPLPFAISSVVEVAVSPKSSYFRTTIRFNTLLVFSIAAVTAHAQQSGWYFSLGVGASDAAGVDLTGWNQDVICYPTFACFDSGADTQVDGYRWAYSNTIDPGGLYEFVVGKELDFWRLEAGISSRSNDVNIDEFQGLTHLSGTAVGSSSSSSVTNTPQNSLGDLTLRSFAINGYRNFPQVLGQLTMYVGAGVSLAAFEVSALMYEDNYQFLGDSPDTSEGELGRYNASQLDSLKASTTGIHIHVGSELPLSSKNSIGVKVTASRFGTFKGQAHYQSHPMHAFTPDFPSNHEFDSTNYWSTTFYWKSNLSR